MNKRKIFAVLLVVMAFIAVFAIGASAAEKQIPAASANSRTITYDYKTADRKAMLALITSEYADTTAYPWAVFEKDSTSACGWKFLKAFPYYLENNGATNSTTKTCDSASKTTAAMNYALMTNDSVEKVIVLRYSHAVDVSSSANTLNNCDWDNVSYKKGAVTVDLNNLVFDLMQKTSLNVIGFNNKGNTDLCFAVVNGTINNASRVSYLSGHSSKTNNPNVDITFKDIKFNYLRGILFEFSTSTANNIAKVHITFDNCKLDFSQQKTDIVACIDTGTPYYEVAHVDIKGGSITTRYENQLTLDGFDGKGVVTSTATVDYTHEFIQTDYGDVEKARTEDPTFALFEKNASGEWVFYRTFNALLDSSTSTKQSPSTTTGALNAAVNLNQSNKRDKVILVLKEYILSASESYDNFGLLACNVLIDMDGNTIDMGGRTNPIIPMIGKNTTDASVSFIDGTITGVGAGGEIVYIGLQAWKTPSTDYPGVVFANAGKKFNVNFTNVTFDDLKGDIAGVYGHEDLKYGVTANITLKDCTINSATTAANNLFKRTKVDVCADEMNVVLDNVTINATEFDTLGADGIDSITIKNYTPQMALALYDSIKPMFRAQNGSYSDVKIIYNGSLIDGAVSGGYTVFDSLDHVSPEKLGDTFTIQLQMTYLGTTVKGVELTTSIEEYCNKALTAAANDAEIALIESTLNYAAAAKTWVAAPDAGDGSAINGDAYTSCKDKSESPSDAKITEAKLSVSLNQGIKVSATATDGFDITTAKLKVELGGKSVMISISEDGIFYFRAATAAAMSEAFTFVFCDAEGNEISATYTFSFESYVKATCDDATASGNLKNLCVAMMAYGNAAKAYAG